MTDNISGSRLSKLNSTQQNLFMASNILSQMVSSSFGPCGSNKFAINKFGDVFILKDGQSIFEKAGFEHPVAKILLDLTSSLSNSFGDGTITSTLFFSNLINNAQKNIELGIHPNIIIDGYNVALKESLILLDRIKMPISTLHDWQNIISTYLSSKFSRLESFDLSNLIFKALFSIDPTFTSQYCTDYVDILGLGGKSINESLLIDGILFDADILSSQMPQSIINGKIAIVQSAISINKGVFEKQIELHDPKSLNDFLYSEKKIMFDMVDYVVNSGANVLFSHKTIDDLTTQRLSRAGILTVKRVPLKKIEMIERSTGCTMVRTPQDLTKNVLGYSNLVKSVQLFDKNWILIDGGHLHKANTLLIRSVNQRLGDSFEDLMKRSLTLLHKTILNPYFVFGGGSIEIDISKKLHIFSTKLDNLDRITVKSFAESLEYVPLVLAYNSGMNKLDSYIKIRNYQSLKKNFMGVDAFSRKFLNMKNKGIIEPASLKSQILISATEAAISVIRVLDVYNISKKNSKT